MPKTEKPKMAKAARASPKRPQPAAADTFVPDEPATAAPPAVDKPHITGITPIGDSSFSLHLSTGDRIECICAGNGGLEANREARARLLAYGLFPQLERKESE